MRTVSRLLILFCCHRLEPLPPQTWKYTKDSIVFRELYNITADKYQLTNIYSSLTDAQKADYEAQISEYWACKGSATAASNCP